MSDFVSNILDFCSHSTEEVVLIMFKAKPEIEFAWFNTASGNMTTKVFLRKYLLKCWEFYNQNPNSSIAVKINNLKQQGEFSHNQCIFDFFITVIYEQIVQTCKIMQKVSRETLTKEKNNVEILMRMALMSIRPSVTKALNGCRKGCIVDCQKNEKLKY